MHVTSARAGRSGRGERVQERDAAPDPVRVAAGDEIPFLHDGTTPRALAAKRALDVAGATALLLLSAPLWAAIALTIRLDTKGPILFVQRRVGAEPIWRAGRLRWIRTGFAVYKFRTMVAGADQGVHEAAVRAYAAGSAAPNGSPNAPYKLAGDARITRVGRILRRTSLDELPQLLNVLLGTMSLVGPRPLPEYEVDAYQPWHFERLCARPGITGLWQIEGRGHASFDEGTHMDIRYVRTRSLPLDIMILLRTVPAVLSRRGAL